MSQGLYPLPNNIYESKLVRYLAIFLFLLKILEGFHQVILLDVVPARVIDACKEEK